MKGALRFSNGADYKQNVTVADLASGGPNVKVGLSDMTKILLPAPKGGRSLFIWFKFPSSFITSY